MKSTALQFNLRSAMKAAIFASAVVLAALAGRDQACAQYDPGQSDLALNKSGTSTGADFSSTFGMGVDGNRDGNFGNGSTFYENAGAPPLFYQIDLGSNQYVNRIQILPRTDTYQSVFGDFTVSIYQDDGFGNPGAVTYSHSFNNGYFGPEFATALPGLTAGGTQGRFVRVERNDNNYWLTFAEMEVIGSATPMTNSLATDIAVGKPVTVFGANAGFGATNASGNDGDINGDFNAPNQGTTGNTGSPVFHTDNFNTTDNIYWQVDLGADTPLSYANLMARMGVNSTIQFQVEVYDSGMNLVSTSIVNNSDVNGATPGYDHAVDLTGVTGEFVRVTVGPDAGNSYLAFSELQVFAAVPEPSSVVLAGIGCIGLVSLACRRVATRRLASHK